MTSTNVRLGAVVEWGIAVACILAAVSLGTIAWHEVRAPRAQAAIIAAEHAPVAAVGVPSGSTSVATLVLRDGTRLQVGEGADDAASKVGTWQVGADAVERSGNGDRVTRSYDDGDERFQLVIEAGGSAPRVSAIYRQDRTPPVTR